MMRLADLGADQVGRLADVHARAFERPWSEGDMTALLANLGVFALGGEDGRGRLLGFVLVQVTAGEGEILTLATRPEARRRGLGRRLVDAAAAVGADRGAESLLLEVAADNAAALALYTAAGFKKIGRRPGYYQLGAGRKMDAIIMRRALNTEPACDYSP